MELWDAYDKNFQKIPGKTLVRGEPIPQGMLEEIFKRFRRGEPSGTEGCGLGLSIAQGIVQTHRGRIWAESGDGVNTFHVRLPAAR